MDYCKYVNVFHGSGRIDLPKPEGVAASWHFIKAICGNTHPGAQLPFGGISAGCYTGGYPTGYGNFLGNSDPRNLREREQGMLCRGFSHFHESGTGAMGIYYNYAVTVPFYGDLIEASVGREMLDEGGRPGYYSVRLPSGILCELTATNDTAVHRYKFERADGRVSIDLSNDGFRNNDPRHRGYSSESEIEIDGNAFQARIVMKGLPLYVYGVCTGAVRSCVWRDYLPIKGDSTLALSGAREDYGVYFEFSEPGVHEVRISFSAVSAAKARENVEREKRPFDLIASDAYDKWNEALGRVEIDAPTARDRDIFYSNLYHTLVKPADRSGDNFIFDGEDFVVDFATLWDMYKTQMPLLFTLYPDISRKIIATLAGYGEARGNMPHTLTLTDLPGDKHSSQAKMLAEHVIYDAWCRGVEADYRAALKQAEIDIFSPNFDEFHAGKCRRATHVVDTAEGCAAMKRLAEALDMPHEAETFARFTESWRSVYDTETGLMVADSDYYEGNCWNFSFRPLSDVDGRVALAGGRDKFVELLDRFFGFTSPGDVSARFEGYNNESDIEAPLSYYYAGRHDRLCEVVAAGLKYMFSDGRGGLPGNNDSGGLSSCYIWNAAGIFPVTGQDMMIIGSPLMNTTVFHLTNGRDFAVRREGEGIYVKRADLNGETLADMSFKASDMMNGGELVLTMSETAMK